MSDKPIEIKTTINIPSTLLADTVESGMIEYWGTIDGLDSAGGEPLKFTSYADAFDRILNHGALLRVAEYVDEENGTGVIHFLSRDIFERALILMREKHNLHFNNIITEEFDADTGDILLQLACFGQLIYG